MAKSQLSVKIFDISKLPNHWLVSRPGWRTGVFYTVMANCALHHLDPFEYWRNSLRDIPSAKEENISASLPANRVPVKEQDP